MLGQQEPLQEALHQNSDCSNLSWKVVEAAFSVPWYKAHIQGKQEAGRWGGARQTRNLAGCSRSANSYEYCGPVFLIQLKLQHHILQIYLKLILVIMFKPMYWNFRNIMGPNDSQCNKTVTLTQIHRKHYAVDFMHCTPPYNYRPQISFRKTFLE